MSAAIDRYIHGMLAKLVRSSAPGNAAPPNVRQGQPASGPCYAGSQVNVSAPSPHI